MIISNGQKMSERKGTGLSGQMYEVNLAMLFLLLGVEKKCTFYLATNMEKAGDFDDIVFKYAGERGRWIVIFLQAKHRCNPKKDKITVEQLLSEAFKGDFNLTKYLKSYRKTRKYFFQGKLDPIFRSEFEDVNFIIYTNATSNFSNNNKIVEKIALEHDSILKLSQETSYCYKLISRGENNRKKISVLQYSSDCKKLARELAKSIFSEQGLVVSKGILMDYHIPLAGDVIQQEEGSREGGLRESFLNSDNQFRRAFFEEVWKRTDFAGKTEDELKSELQSKSFALSVETETRTGNYPVSLPTDLVSEDEIQEFLDKLNLFVDQPGEEELVRVIKRKIQEIFRVEDEDIYVVYTDVKYKVLYWWKDANNYLTQSNRFFQDSIRISIRFDVRKPVTSFIGRTTELEELHEVLQNGSKAVISQAASITGLGGVGKSELARKYISEYNEHYDDNIIWIMADDYFTISKSFRRLAVDRLEISSKDKHGKEKSILSIVSDVYGFFAKTHRKSLFVFDNAGKYHSYDETDEGISKFLPFDSCKPHILITSRNQEWDQIKTLTLNVFTEDEAAEFIENALKGVIEFEEDEVCRLAKELQYLPLALRQAVAYIDMENGWSGNWKKGRFTISKYLQLFQSKAAELLGKTVTDDNFSSYGNTVLTTWSTTTDKIKGKYHGEMALEILDALAYLAPDNIPVESIFCNKIENEKMLHGAVELLHQYSMVCLEYGMLNIHRLVQRVTRIKLEGRGEDSKCVKDTCMLLTESFPFNKHTADDYLTQKELLPHLESILCHLENVIVKEPEAKRNLEEFYIARLIELMDDGYSNTGNPRRRIELLERALGIEEEYYGSDHLQSVKTLVNLGNAHGHCGDPLNKCELLKRALVIHQNHSSDDKKVAIIYTNLGNAYGDLGNPQMQKDFLKKALLINEKCYGCDSLEVTKSLASLGNAYGRLGNPHKKMELLTSALGIEEKYYGSEHHEVAPTLANLADAYSELGDHEKKKELLEKVLRIQEKQYGRDHFEVAITLSNLGNAHCELGNPSLQRDYIERALPVTEKHYGKNHYIVAKLLVNLGIAYGELGDHQTKMELIARALTIEEEFYGTDHFEVATTLTNLSNAYLELGEPLKQKDLLERALLIQEKHYGSDNYQVAKTLVGLGNVYGDLAQHQRKLEILEKALQIKESHYGSDHFDVAKTLENIGIAHGDLGDRERKREKLERSLQIKENYYGKEHYEVAITLTNLGITYGDLGFFQKQIELLEKSLKMREGHYGYDNLSLVLTLTMLAVGHGKVGNHQKKKDLLERALEIQEKRCDREFKILKTLIYLCEVYGQLHDFIKLKETLERALSIFRNSNNPIAIKLRERLNLLNSTTFLHLACRYCDLDMVKTLIARGYDVFARDNHDTVLHQATSGDDERITRLILDEIMEKSNHDSKRVYEVINAKDSEGDTPLMWAAQNGKANAAELLLEYGAGTDEQNNDGETALHWAAKGGHQLLVQLLLNNGASPNYSDNNGKTPLDVAEEKLAGEPGSDNLKWVACLLLSVTGEPVLHEEEGPTGSRR